MYVGRGARLDSGVDEFLLVSFLVSCLGHTSSSEMYCKSPLNYYYLPGNQRYCFTEEEIAPVVLGCREILAPLRIDRKILAGHISFGVDSLVDCRNPGTGQADRTRNIRAEEEALHTDRTDKARVSVSQDKMPVRAPSPDIAGLHTAKSEMGNGNEGLARKGIYVHYRIR